MDAVNEFLRRKETHIADSPLFVMGNESADLDSMVAAVAYAFFESHANQSCSVPVINIPRNEFVFRAEAVWLFESLGIPHDRLTFVDELDLGQFCKEGSAKLFLVDHNKLCPRQTDLAPMVCGTVDHHVDEGLYSSTCTHRRVVRLCGSATTLVAEAFFESGACSSALTPALAKLLLAAILVDTVNLDPAHQKVPMLRGEAGRCGIQNCRQLRHRDAAWGCTWGMGHEDGHVHRHRAWGWGMGMAKQYGDTLSHALGSSAFGVTTVAPAETQCSKPHCPV